MRRFILCLLMLATVTVVTAHEERRWPAWLSAGQDDAVVSVGNTQGAIPLTTLLTSFGDYGKVAIADHLGSITRLVNASGTTVFSASYDAWGKQSVGTTTVKLHRGYTGHEMLSEYGLINMRSALWDASLAKNGRLYDPQLGRFLSPDRSAMPLGSSKNYVQQPDDSQNFNRYSYCLNNPLKYNDPSGEWLILSAVSGLIRGAVKLISGHGQWYSPFYNAYKNVANDVKNKWGLFKGSPKQILSRFTWELPQTILGYEYSNYRLVVSDIDKVRYFDGATYVINQPKSTTNGVTLGSFININTTHPIPVDSKGHFAPFWQMDDTKTNI